jgi:hypothetical protein
MSPKKPEDRSIEQTAIGNDNIQVIGSNNIITRITNFFVGDTEQQIERRNRRIMLDHVENFWVKGVFEKSLHGVALLELGIREDPGAVHYPWTIKTEPTNKTLPAGKSMLEIFKEVGLARSLLILGAPGSGKTTMLLELTRQLIEQARQDDTDPIPVVFNLASWKENQTLPAWLVEQLNTVYYVPKRISPTWIRDNRMLLLLDGFDEVKEDSRAKCVEAINQFRKEHGLTSLVICSRIQEYTTINTKLLFEGAITLQPLAHKQISAYFNRFGESFAPINQLLKKDRALQELAETPLMLSIMALAYKEGEVDELITTGDLEKHRKHLFATYVMRMFERSMRTVNAPLTKQRTLHYLYCLAQMMTKHNIVTYQIENMQPEWLQAKSQRRLYRIFIGLIFGLPFGPIYALIVGPSVVQNYGLIGGLLTLLIFGLIYGLIFGLIGVLIVGEKIIMVDKLKWSWKEAGNGLRGGTIAGLFSGLIVVVLMGDLIFGLIFGFINALLGGLFGGLRGGQIEETTYPGQHLKQTLLNTVFFLLIYGLIAALFFWLMTSLNAGLIVGLPAGLIFGLMIGLSVGLLNAGKGLIQHFALRFMLARYQLLPLRLIPFLEYAVNLIFLRRVGGSYIFIHRLLMEHFAAMYPVSEK